MPEGDTLARTAATLQRWLGGREVTAATTPVEGLAATRLVGLRVEAVEARGKHLLVRFDTGHVLHSHLRMSGSWHVYREGEAWRRPPAQARLTLACGERLAVCFNAPVLELLRPGAEALHAALPALGPDVLDRPLAVAEIVARARRQRPEQALGELLLDQRVACGIGNIWRCETLFAERRHPETALGALDDAALGALYRSAARLMAASAGGSGRPAYAVYGRAGRPCRRCGTLVRSQRQGADARTAYWCPRCQPEP